jgi:hypothetical protein
MVVFGNLLASWTILGNGWMLVTWGMLAIGGILVNRGSGVAYRWCCLEPPCCRDHTSRSGASGNLFHQQVAVIGHVGVNKYPETSVSL